MDIAVREKAVQPLVSPAPDHLIGELMGLLKPLDKHTIY